MNSLNKLPIILLSVLILVFALIYFSLKIASISYNEESQEITTDKINSEILIYRDFYGIPFIKANSDEDLYFAMGYEHALSRMWQMDFLRRVSSGSLSEIFGANTVNIDKFMRALEIENLSDTLLMQISPQSKKILEKYSEGVNEYIKNNKNKLSVEFSALNYIPEKWEPKHSLMIGKAMAFEMSISFWIEAAYADIATKFGLEIAKKYIPDYDISSPFITDENLSEYNKLHLKEIRNDSNAASLFSTISNDLLQLRNKLGWSGTAVGSNSWVANKNFSDSLGTILANDPHLSVGLPAKWTFMQIVTPNKHVLGFSVPGIPAFISGRNENISWGITNMMADICDFYVEKLDSTNKKYEFNNNFKSIIFEKDTILIKNANPLIYYKRKTHRSNIISDLHLFQNDSTLLKLNQNELKSVFFEQYAVTFEWAAKYFSDDIKAADGIVNSSNFKDFRESLDNWGFPALNFSYGDKIGNFGIVPAGKIPNRNSQCEPNLPNPGWDKDAAWSGISAKNLPYILNPKKNFVASANNKIDRELDLFISNHWEPDSRIKRIEEMLAVTEKYSVRDAQIMQSDVLSPYAREICEISIPVLENLNKIMSKSEKDALKLIKNWDYIISPVGPSSAIYNVFFERLIYNTFHDELGDQLYRKYTFVSNVPTRKLMELLQEGTSDLFDDINTDEVENVNFVIYKSFNEAIKELREIFNSIDMTSWNWGELHIIDLKHVLSANEFLQPSVSTKPMSIGGNNTTINNTEYRIYDPFQVVLNASMRFITDMNDSIVYTSLPGGISGDPINPHYTNQVRLWLNGGYLKTNFTISPNSEYELRITITNSN